ncbi:MAG TPA: hypothetical protein DDZ89_07320 [Clostridiales bacterium]|nr:hypothetical protein [Clostridiales bacterium]
MSIDDVFNEIMDHAHFWNWLPDWGVVRDVYRAFPNSYSVLTPFAYTYLEELIRSTTSEYGIMLLDNSGQPKRRKVGIALIELAITENSDNTEYTKLLEKTKDYFKSSEPEDLGSNRNNVVHGYMHPRFWDEDNFESLLHDIAKLSRFSNF